VATVRVHKDRHYGNHLSARFRLPGKKKSGRLLVLGHLDTVYPLGTLAQMPFRMAQGRLWGPGVFDMKTGLAILVFAVEALHELDRPVAREVVAQLNSDEEIGSPSSRPLTEAAAKQSAAVLVLEPSAGLEGRAKTGRKGVGSYTLRVKGKASHAGLDFEAGASAVLELSCQLLKIADFTDLKRGITVSPGLIGGGTRSNVIPEDAWAEVDVRLERTAEVVRLYRHAQRLAAELGVELGETQVGGGSDGNFTAALGVPTLDGLGAVGEGAHAAHESVLIDRLADRVALVARLLETL
jgi:glutamate carboxypeptidase